MSEHHDAAANLRAVVDQLTRPTHRRVDRDTQAEWRTTVEHDRDWEHGTVCNVAIYRATIERIRAAELAYGRIPSLWQQAEWALTTGTEKAEGGSSPLRERSPADLDLMETMLTIRETMPWQLKGRNITPRATIPEQIQQLAAHIVGHEPHHVEWWTYRLGQWARLLANHLRALDNGPKPVYLRNAPCPICHTRQTTLTVNGEPHAVPALVIDFEHGMIRAAQCQACGNLWWRGDQLGELADLLDTPGAETVSA